MENIQSDFILLPNLESGIYVVVINTESGQIEKFKLITEKGK